MGLSLFADTQAHFSNQLSHCCSWQQTSSTCHAVLIQLSPPSHTCMSCAVTLNGMYLSFTQSSIFFTTSQQLHSCWAELHIHSSYSIGRTTSGSGHKPLFKSTNRSLHQRSLTTHHHSLSRCSCIMARMQLTLRDPAQRNRLLKER